MLYTTLLAATGQTWWQVLLAESLSLTVSVVVPVLSVFVVTLFRRWRINIELEQVEKIATTSIGWVEEKAHQALKVGGKKTPSAEKLKAALEFGKGLADQYKLRAKAVDKLGELIESKLGQSRKAEPAA